ncbi:TPA: AraC family transcriptional regulator, partial [Campylobacter jejuni]|nr:AraC family transcriptional regulator [Campylobacter jejuni]
MNKILSLPEDLKQLKGVNAFLIELIYKYKDFFKLDQKFQNYEIFWVKNDKILQGILESFSPHFEENT